MCYILDLIRIKIIGVLTTLSTIYFSYCAAIMHYASPGVKRIGEVMLQLASLTSMNTYYLISLPNWRPCRNIHTGPLVTSARKLLNLSYNFKPHQDNKEWILYSAISFNWLADRVTETVCIQNTYGYFNTVFMGPLSLCGSWIYN